MTTHTFREGSIDVIEAGPASANTIGYLHGPIGNPVAHPFIEHLAQARRVIAPSLPGFGASDTSGELRVFTDWVFALSEIIDDVGLTGSHVVAASTGAMIALELAAVRPEAFSRLDLISPLGLWDDATPVGDMFGQRLTAQREILLDDPPKADVFFEDDPADPDAVQRGVERYLTRRAAAQLVWPIPDHGLAERIHRVKCPVRILWGAKDMLVPPGYHDIFAKAINPAPITTVVDDAGHLVEWDQPEVVAEKVLS